MEKIKLLKYFEGNNEGEIIEVTKKVAKDLIRQGVAEECATSDFLKKSKIGRTKAFNKSPKNKSLI